MREILIEKNTGSIVHISVAPDISDDTFKLVYDGIVEKWNKAHKEDTNMATIDVNGYLHTINARRIVDIYMCKRIESKIEDEEDHLLKTDQT